MRSAASPDAVLTIGIHCIEEPLGKWILISVLLIVHGRCFSSMRSQNSLNDVMRNDGPYLRIAMMRLRG